MLHRKSLSTQQGSDTGTDEELEIPERAVMDQWVLRVRVAADREEKNCPGPRQRPGLAAALSLVRLQGPLFTSLSKNKALAEQWMGPSTPGQQKADVPSQGDGQPTCWRQAMDSSLGFKGWTPGAEDQRRSLSSCPAWRTGAGKFVGGEWWGVRGTGTGGEKFSLRRHSVGGRGNDLTLVGGSWV